MSQLSEFEDRVATVLYTFRITHRIRHNKMFDELTDSFADAFSAANARFNRRKFIAQAEFGPFQADKIADAKLLEYKALAPRENMGEVLRTK